MITVDLAHDDLMPSNWYKARTYMQIDCPVICIIPLLHTMQRHDYQISSKVHKEYNS